MATSFARKSVEYLQEKARFTDGTSLPKSLGLFSLTCFGIGSTIGAGIFVLTGTVAAEHAGPAVVLCFLLASVACALAGMCYAEFAAMVPVAGSAYTYAYATLGELVAWLIGWCLVLEYLFAAGLASIGWSGYVLSLSAEMGLRVPAILSQAPLDVSDTGLVATGAIVNAPAVLDVLLCTLLLIAGTRVSAGVNTLIVIANVLAIVVVGIAGLTFAHSYHWTPFIPANTGRFGAFGTSGVFTGAAIVFFAYIGFDSVSTMAQETRNPQRVVPIALIATLAICTALYGLVALMVTGLTDYHALGVPNPVYVALAAAGPKLNWARSLVTIVIIVGLVSAVLVALLGQVRIFYAMARDGLLPSAFMAVHPRWRIPHVGTVVTAVLAALIAGFFPLSLLGELISIGTLLAFVMVCVGVIVLRRLRPDLPRPFRVPGYPWTPLLGVVVCLSLMASLPGATWVRLLLWLAIGMAVYWSYGARHSLLRNQPKAPAPLNYSESDSLPEEKV